MAAPTTLVFFYGKNGAGEDTQGKRLVTENPGWSGVSTGDEIKAALKDPTHRHYPKLEPYRALIDQGINLPDSVVIDPLNPRSAIYSEFVEEQMDLGSPVIISTGFPRKLSQLDLLNEYLATLETTQGKIDVKHVYLDVSDQTVRERIAKRREEALSRGEKPRTDDDPQVVENRLRVFTKDTMPVVERLKSEGRIHIIDAEGTPEEVDILVRAELFPKPPLEISIPGRERR